MSHLPPCRPGSSPLERWKPVCLPITWAACLSAEIPSPDPILALQWLGSREPGRGRLRDRRRRHHWPAPYPESVRSARAALPDAASAAARSKAFDTPRLRSLASNPAYVPHSDKHESHAHRRLTGSPRQTPLRNHRIQDRQGHRGTESAQKGAAWQGKWFIHRTLEIFDARKGDALSSETPHFQALIKHIPSQRRFLA